MATGMKTDEWNSLQSKTVSHVGTQSMYVLSRLSYTMTTQDRDSSDISHAFTHPKLSLASVTRKRIRRVSSQWLIMTDLYKLDVKLLVGAVRDD